MRKLYVIGFSGVALLTLIGVARSIDIDTLSIKPTRLSVVDVVECNQYARWIAARATSPTEDDPGDAADERLLHGALLNTGTLEGLAESNQDDARAADAYRRCMVRRGYKAWG